MKWTKIPLTMGKSKTKNHMHLVLTSWESYIQKMTWSKYQVIYYKKKPCCLDSPKIHYFGSIPHAPVYIFEESEQHSQQTLQIDKAKNTRSEPRTQDQEKFNQIFKCLLHQKHHSPNITIIKRTSMDIRRKNTFSYDNSKTKNKQKTHKDMNFTHYSPYQYA